MGYPFWVTTTNLGTYQAGSSLTLAPIVLVFGETDNLPCVVSLLNGGLPPGVQFNQSGYQITLKGELQGVGSTQIYSFTFRIHNQTYVSDRTFQITVSQDISVFEWITSNTDPLLYVYDDQPQRTQIATECVPIQAVTYSCTNLNLLTQGISLDTSSGVFTINLGWRANTTYTINKDYVYSNDRLYVCAASGTSSSTQGPQLPGSFVVDTVYPVWQPNRVYNQGTVVNNSIGKIYLCIQTGTSGSGTGPSGISNYIPDGSVFWAYQTQALVWNQVTPNTQITQSLQCVAQASTVINRTFDVKLVSREAAPIWLTPAGLILSLTPTQLFAYQLQVQDPDQAVLTWSSSNLPSWISLSVTGELFGQAPQVPATTSFTFDILVSDPNNSLLRSFSIQVMQMQPELSWLTGSQLPTTRDGVMSDLNVQAVSPIVGANITYGWVGGMIPLGLRLDSQTGYLQGFVEFHAQDRLYEFEVQASDGVNLIQKQFQVQVIALDRNIYWTLHMPVWGQERLNIVGLNNASVINDDLVYLLNQPVWGRVSRPTIPIISGSKACAVDDLRLLITNYMHAWDVQLGQLQITELPDLHYRTLDVQLTDAVAPPVWKPQTAYVLNQRVSVGNGDHYQALNAGTSGIIAPVWNQDQVKDGLITWLRINSPNTQSAKSSPLPWYAYHEYMMGQTIMRQGVTYECAQPGTSGGTWPLTTAYQTQVSDNQVIWLRVNQVPEASNTYWPSCVTNMRRVVEAQLGWSTSLGQNAQVMLNVNTSTGEILGVNVINPGTGYWQAPPVHVISNTGTGAQLETRVGILSASVLSSDTNVQDLTQFEIDLGEGTPAILLVDGVTAYDQAARITVISTGSYSQVPSVPFTVMVGNAKVTLRLEVGVVGAQVIMPGTKYQQSDQVTLLGQEWDPVRYQFVDQFDLNMCVAYVLPDVTVSLENLSNPYVGSVLHVNRVQADLQGVQWQGNTRFDGDTCTWDAHATHFVEQTTASETQWDQSELTWDQNVTTFDRDAIMLYPHISQTVFDQDHTIFDYYATVFDALPVQYESRTLKSWVWFMSMHV